MKKRIRLLTGILIIICCSCVAAGKENTGESEGDGFYSGQTEDTEKAAEVINQDLVVMPYEPLPEEDFAFDPDTGTIMKYKGDAVDVIIPRSIGGIPVENISYHAFESTKDYFHSEMMTNQKEGDWIPMRCLILPETFRSIEDSAFSYCQDLETVICYAPLETTNKGVFRECTGLKTVIFVNGVRHMDNYLFGQCRSLKTVWYKDQADRIGIQCFSDTGLEELCINAREIDSGAFIGNESLKTVHIRSGVERLQVTAFASNPALETVCLEFCDPAVLESSLANLNNDKAVILVPEETTDEQIHGFMMKFGPWGASLIVQETQIQKGKCHLQETSIPDVSEILREYGM